MKIVKANGDPFSFRYDGSTSVEVTKEGVSVSDEVAAVAQSRFDVTVSDAPEGATEEVIKEPAPTVPSETPVSEAPIIRPEEPVNP